MTSAAESQPDVVVDLRERLAPFEARCVSEAAKRLRDAPKHPHLVRVISVDRVGDSWSIASESIDGVALADVFLRLSLGARLRVVVDVLAALSALHALDGGPVIHGGVLSRVAFVDKSGRTKLGCAYAQSLFMKKDSYAPESLLGDQAAIGPHTDVYGAGVLLWEAITGQELFGIDAPEEIVKKQLAGRIAKALPSARDRWARVVLPVIERALRVNPGDRYVSISEMAAALRIAVRARLMIHDDIVEEIWPAATQPKVQSGVQPISPSAPPAVAEAALQVVATPSAPIAVSTSAIVVLAPPRRSRVGALAAGAVGFFAVLVVVAVMLVHARARPVAAHADATPDERAPAAETLPATSPTVEREEVKPLEAPAASGVPTAAPPPQSTAGRKARTPKARAYDPSSI